MNKRPLITGLAVLAGVAAAGTGAWWWHAGAAQQAVIAGLPATPDLSSAPAPIRKRLAAAEAQARSRFGAVKIRRWSLVHTPAARP